MPPESSSERTNSFVKNGFPSVPSIELLDETVGQFRTANKRLRETVDAPPVRTARARCRKTPVAAETVQAYAGADASGYQFRWCGRYQRSVWLSALVASQVLQASMEISAACKSSRNRISGFPAARRVSVRASSSKICVRFSGPWDRPPCWASFESPVAAARISLIRSASETVTPDQAQRQKALALLSESWSCHFAGNIPESLRKIPDKERRRPAQQIVHVSTISLRAFARFSISSRSTRLAYSRLAGYHDKLAFTADCGIESLL